MSGRSARIIRIFSVGVSPDLVLLDIKKSTFQHLTVNCKVTSLWPPSSRTKLLFSIFTYPIIHLKNRKNLKTRISVSPPTPPHPTPAFPFNVVAFPINVMAFEINVMAFPINGMAFPINVKSPSSSLHPQMLKSGLSDAM